MTDPLTFTSLTPRNALPLLFAGQAQKEVSVNSAFALADMLIHPAVEGEASAPPSAPAEGECWLVAEGAVGVFAGQEHALAGFQAGTWIFARPKDGMCVFDRASGQRLCYAGGWRREGAPLAPAGGTVVDQEARAAVAELIRVLRRTCILPAI
jgi:hypothetical protein